MDANPNTIDGKSITERGTSSIENDAEAIVNKLLKSITEDESKRYLVGEKIGKLVEDTNLLRLDKVGNAIRESVKQKLKAKKIEILFPDDSRFPFDVREENNCYIFSATETIVA